MRPREVSAWVPRYGTVRSLVLLVLLAIVVLRAENPLRETLATVFGMDGEVAWLAVLALLGMVALGTLVVEYRRQTKPFPSFIARDVREKFLEQRIPPRPLFAAYVVLLVVGGYVALFARDVFFARIDGAFLVVRRLVTTGDPGTFSLSAFAHGTLFALGAAAFAHAADRVLVAAARKLIADWETREH